MRHVQIRSAGFQGEQTVTVMPTSGATDAPTPTDADTVRAALGRQTFVIELQDAATDEQITLVAQRMRGSETRIFFDQVCTPKLIDAIRSDSLAPDELIALAHEEMGVDTDFDFLAFFQNIKVKIVAAAMQDTALQDEAFWQDADSSLLDTLFDVITGNAEDTPDRDAEIARLTRTLDTVNAERDALDAALAQREKDVRVAEEEKHDARATLETCKATLTQRDTDLATVTERLQTCEKENAALIAQLQRAEERIGPPEDTLFSGEAE